MFQTSAHPSTRALPIGVSRHGMMLSVIEGLLSAGYFAFMERWLTPLLLNRMGGDRQTLAMVLSNLPMFTSMALGIVMGMLVRRLGGNRRATLISAWTQTVALGLIIPAQLAIDSCWGLPLAMSAACTIAVVGSIGATGWQSWMSDLVPPPVKGRYFGRRSMAFAVAGMVYVGIYAQIIAWLPISKEPSGGTGLLIVTIAALTMRLASAVTLTLQPGAKHVVSTAPHESVVDSLKHLLGFARHMHRHAVGRWLLTMTFMYFAIGISSPFILMYQIAPLDKGGLALTDQPLLYAAIYWTAAVVRLIAYPLLGRATDRFGAHQVLRFSVPGLAIIMFCWAFIREPWLLLFSEMLAALSWCGVDCAQTMMLWGCHHNPNERPRIMGYQQTFNGLAMLLGGLVGAALIDTVGSFNGSSYRSLFLISAMLRLTVAVIAFRVLATCVPSRDQA